MHQRLFGQKSGPKLGFRCEAQKLMHNSGLVQLAFLYIFVIISIKDALPADMCKAVALRDVRPVGCEDPSIVLRRGEHAEAVTQYIDNRKTGETIFCSHGDFCYPTHVMVKGKRVEALRLVNCKVDGFYDSEGENKAKDPDAEEIIYAVVMDRSKNTPHDLLLDDIDDKLLEMGLCSACAGNVAMYYVERPNSKCARIAKKALAGDQGAIDELQSFPSYCEWKIKSSDLHKKAPRNTSSE